MRETQRNPHETMILQNDEQALKSGEVLRTFNSLAEDGLDTAAISYVLKHADQIQSGIEVNRLLDKLDAYVDSDEVDQDRLAELQNRLDARLDDIAADATPTEIIDANKTQVLKKKETVDELAEKFKEKLEAEPVDPEAKNKKRFANALERTRKEQTKTISGIRSEMKSWQMTIDDEEGLAGKNVLIDDFFKMTDTWKSELAEIGTADAQSLVDEIDQARVSLLAGPEV